MATYDLEKVANEVSKVNQRIKENFKEIEASIESGDAKNSSAKDVEQVSNGLRSLKIAFKEFNETRKQFKELRKAYKQATKL